ncbi:MAG TPA: hypothetical protein VKA09_01800 [Nitrososphaeraceae archaeon]|nr:hypothetical protein [Nitrososphaeraceae archaeon]
MKIEIVRPDDLLNLRVQAINLRLDADIDPENPNKPVLVVEDLQQPSYLIVTFPPQAIAEGAYFQAGGIREDQTANDNNRTRLLTDKGTKEDDPKLDIPGQLDQSGNEDANPRRQVSALLGRPSRLVFKVPAIARIPFSIEGLLNWTDLDLNVSPIAAIGRSPSDDQVSNAPAIQPPASNETAIELPYNLLISPTQEVMWKHRFGQFTSRGRTELWHTRLALKVPKTPITPDGTVELSRNQSAPLRAIWSPDYKPDDPPSPTEKDKYLARTAMSPNDRYQIVALTSGFQGYQVPGYVVEVTRSGTEAGFFRAVPYLPKPIEAEQLMLSPLGGWLRSQGHWSTLPEAAPPVIIDVIPDVRRILRPLESLTIHGANVAIAQPVNMNEELTAMNEELTAISGLRSPHGRHQLDLSAWAHIATEGRDHYVRIVYDGELWPFRHPASLVKVTERKFRENNGIVGAYLIQRMFIIVREPDKEINNHGNPFKHVRLTTMVTPDIVDPDTDKIKIKGANRSFWVAVPAPTDDGHERFKFHAVGTDHGKQSIDFTIPLIFVSISDVEDTDKAKLVAAEYNDIKNGNIENSKAEIFGQKIMFAEQDKDVTKRNDNTQLVTEALNFMVDAAGNPPRMLKADVKIPQVQELLGSDAPPSSIRYYEDYVNNGFKSAKGVFAQVVKLDPDKFDRDNPFAALGPATIGVDFSADKAGGFATPNMAISTLTREIGPVAGDIKDAVNNKFNPKEFFSGDTAQLFGTFKLFDLINPTTLDKNAPKLNALTKNNDDGSKSLIATLHWEPEFLEPTKRFNAKGIVKIEKDRNGKVSALKIHGKIQKSMSLNEPIPDSVESEFTGKLNDFSVTILDSVTINFVEFSFTSSNGQKPDVDVKLFEHPFKFDGDLKFIEEIRDAIPPNLFGKGSGPSIDLVDNPLGIRAGFALALPPLAMGVFALKDVSLGAALTLPFLDGKPVFDFNVSERQHPFMLTVSLFGGGGFFRLQLDTAGMKELQAALEFGAAAAIDIGVASGEVHIMAGIYFSLQRKENDPGGDLTAVLSGYLRMGGSLSVLGLIRISVEFNLSFTYDSVKDKAYGRATLTVHIEVLFFSESVELTVERAFGGSSDPTFGDLFTDPEVWGNYALAFAGG